MPNCSSHVVSSERPPLCQSSTAARGLRLAHAPDLYLGSATWRRSDWSFLVVLFCTTETCPPRQSDMEKGMLVGICVGRGRGTDGFDHSSCSLDSTHIYVRPFFFSFSVQVAQVFTHISPFVSVGLCFIHHPCCAFRLGVIFVIGVNQLLFFPRNLPNLVCTVTCKRKTGIRFLLNFTTSTSKTALEGTAGWSWTIRRLIGPSVPHVWK